MNVPKLAAQLAVILLAVALLYPTINSAVPKEIPSQPFDVQLDGGISTSVNSNMEVELSMPDLIFTSSLPEAFKNVSGAVYIGNSSSRICIGTYHADVVEPNTEGRMTFEKKENMSVPYLLSYLPIIGTGSGVEIPIYLGIGFEYMEWNGTELIDLSLIMKASVATAGGSVSEPMVVGNDSRVTINPGSSGMAAAAIQQVKAKLGDDVSFEFVGGGSMNAKIQSDGTVTFTTMGTVEKNVAEIAEEMLKKDGKISMTYGGNPVVIQGDNADAMVSALKHMYPAEA